MRPRHLLTLALAGCAGAAAAAMPASPAAVLAGRTAGPARACIPLFESDQRTQLFGDGSILYGGSGGTLYINKPENCPAFRIDTAIATVNPIGQLCRGDIIRLFDPTAHFTYGSCTLGEFTPYAKAPHAKTR